MHHFTDIIANIMVFVTPVVEHWLEQEILSFECFFLTFSPTVSSSIVEYPLAICSSIVKYPLMMQWVVRSIPYCGPIELFLVPASALQLVYQRTWYVFSCLWDGAYKRTHAAIRNSSPCCGVSRFLFSLSSPSPYVWSQIKCVECVIK